MKRVLAFLALAVVAIALLSLSMDGRPGSDGEASDSRAPSGVAPEPELRGRGSRDTDVATSGEGPGVPEDRRADPTATPPVGRLWTVTAHVSEDRARKVPVAGASVTIWMRIGQSLNRIGQSTTGASGVALIDLSSLKEMSRTQLGVVDLVGFASAPGHSDPIDGPSLLTELLGDDAQQRPWQMQFVMEPGPSVRGRVTLDDGGSPTGTEVTLVRLDRGSTHAASSVRVDPNGRYALPIPGKGRYDLVTKALSYRSHRSGEFLTDGVQDVTAKPVVLARLPATQGIVQFADGSPVADLNFSIYSPFADIAQPEWMGASLSVRTDARGKFQAVLDSLWIELPMAIRAQIPGTRYVTGGTFLASDPNPKLVIDLCRLRVRVTDTQGRPLRGLTVEFRDGARGPFDGLTDEAGEASIFLAHGSSGTVAVTGPGNALTWKRLHLPESGNEHRVELEITEPEPVGWIDLQTRPFGAVSPYPTVVRVLSLDGVAHVHQYPEQALKPLPLPPGTYIVATSFRVDEPPLPGAYKVRSAIVTSGPIKVQSGRTSEIAIGGFKGARLAVFLDSEERAAGTAEAPNCKVSLRHPSGYLEQVHLHTPSDDGPKEGCWFGAWAHSNRLRPSGIYELSVMADGFHPSVHELQMIDGEVASVRLTLHAKE